MIEFQALLNEFADLAAISDPIQQQFELITRAKKLKLPIGRFEKMFFAYQSEQEGGDQ